MKKLLLGFLFIIFTSFGFLNFEVFLQGETANICEEINKETIGTQKLSKCKAESVCRWSDNKCLLVKNFGQACDTIYTADECNITSGCEYKRDKCRKTGFLGIGDGERKDREIINNTHCSEKYLDETDTNTDYTKTNDKNLKKSISKQYELICDADDRCKWSNGQCKGVKKSSTENAINCDNASSKTDSNSSFEKNTQACLNFGGEFCTYSKSDKRCIIDESLSSLNEEYSPFAVYTGPVFEGPGLRSGARITKTKLDNTISKERSLKNLILGWTKFGLSIVSVLAVVALIWAGSLYITDMGDGSGQEKAKKIIMYVVIGMIVILGSYAIVNTVMKARFGSEGINISLENSRKDKIIAYNLNDKI